MSKIIIDTPDELWGEAMIAIVRVKAEFPDQKTGTSNAVVYPIENNDYVIIRNRDSYTAKIKAPDFGSDDLQQATPTELVEEDFE